MFRAICVLCFLGCILVGSCMAQAEVDHVTRDSATLTIPNPFGPTPFFETRNENGRVIGFHVPFIADWLVHNREGDGLGNTKYTWRWLSGLVNINYDRVRNPATGELEGPVKFSILGIPLWDNGETTPAPPTAAPAA